MHPDEVDNLNHKIPEHMRDAMRLWIERGVPGGSFLNSVLCNDLSGAFGRADDINRAALGDYVSFLYWDAPSGCWGSPEKVKERAAVWRAWRSGGRVRPWVRHRGAPPRPGAAQLRSARRRRT